MDLVYGKKGGDKILKERYTDLTLFSLHQLILNQKQPAELTVPLDMLKEHSEDLLGGKSVDVSHAEMEAEEPEGSA